MIDSIPAVEKPVAEGLCLEVATGFSILSVLDIIISR